MNVRPLHLPQGQPAPVYHSTSTVGGKLLVVQQGSLRSMLHLGEMCHAAIIWIKTSDFRLKCRIITK